MIGMIAPAINPGSTITVFFSTLFCHNSRFSYGNKMKLNHIIMQNFMENPVKLTEYIYIYIFLEQKVLLNIQLGVACMDMVDFRRLGHNYDTFMGFLYLRNYMYLCMCILNGLFNFSKT